MTIDSRLKEIKERCDASTEGPWDNHLYVDVAENKRYYGGPCGYSVTENDTEQSHEQRHFNRRFCAKARTDVPMLLEIVKELLEYHDDATTNFRTGEKECSCLPDEDPDANYICINCRLEKIAKKYNP